MEAFTTAKIVKNLAKAKYYDDICSRSLAVVCSHDGGGWTLRNNGHKERRLFALCS